jgi:hypothetical protein
VVHVAAPVTQKIKQYGSAAHIVIKFYGFVILSHILL